MCVCGGGGVTYRVRIRGVKSSISTLDVDDLTISLGGAYEGAVM